MNAKKMLFAIPLAFIIFMGLNVSRNVFAADSSLMELPQTNGKLTDIPQNTTCRKIDFGGDKNRNLNNRTEVVGDITSEDIYDLCIGTFPRFPSTSVEEGISPVYYAKYYFIPDPMPVYTVTSNKTNINGTVIEGLDQTFVMDKSIEEKTLASDKDVFAFYPYSNKHVDNNFPVANPTILGPYQIGYNSFFHNTYRARYFASEVTFDFDVLEPKAGSLYVREDGDEYKNSTSLFSGSIYYKLEENCFDKEYLDYTDDCRSIEFYFPKGTVTDKTYEGTIKDTVTSSGSSLAEQQTSINTVPKDRLDYKNPGQHYLILETTENMQLRYQKDLGAEFQTVGSSNAYHGQNTTEKEVYFPRLDINGGLSNPNFASSEKTTVGIDSLAVDSKGHYTFAQAANENFKNRCDFTTGAFGDVLPEGTSTGTLERKYQNSVSCYHDESSDNHYWKYFWSNTQWYAADPYLSR